jgi:hypothetical protein
VLNAAARGYMHAHLTNKFKVFQNRSIKAPREGTLCIDVSVL